MHLYMLNEMLIVGGELIHANFDVIGDECMYNYGRGL